MSKGIAIAALLLLACAAAEGRRHRYWREDTEAHSGRQAQEFQWFTVKLDEFDPANTATMKLRYLVNETYWGGVGYPIMVMLGGEGPLSPRELSGRFIINDYAAAHRALMVAIEHRFYGESMPEGGLTLPNLHYLSSHQANADFAAFISFVKQTYKTGKSKVVTLGGSYSGSLSAWMRQKYPALVDGAVASSAPVLAQVDFPDYLNVVQASLGPRCTQRVREAYAAISKKLESATGRAEMAKAYSACDPISTERFDQATFLSSISNPLCDTVQYNRDNINRSIDIDVICAILETGDDAEAAMRALHKFWNEHNGVKCIDSTYKATIDELSHIDPTDPFAASRAWMWQTCTEFGYYQTAEGPDTAFNTMLDLNYFLSMCRDAYGVQPLDVFANIDMTNVLYGGRAVSTTNVVLPNGSIDPWHALGVTETEDPNLVPIYIVGTAHCADLYSPGVDDLPTLTAARTKIYSLLDQWIGK